MAYFLLLFTLFADLDKEVEVSGYYYETADGSPFLSSEPQVKSCCRGVSGKREEQLFLLSSLLLREGSVVQLKGTIREKEGRFFLEEGEVITKNSSFIEWGGVACLLLILYVVVRRVLY